MDLLKWLRRSEQKEVPAASLGPLQIVKPWARSSSQYPDLAGAFMTVANDGDTDRLVSASCPVASSIEIHAIRVKVRDWKCGRSREAWSYRRPIDKS